VRSLLLALVLVSVVAAGCGGDSASPPAATGTPVEETARPPAPPIAGVSLTGERISLEGFRGRPVLVNVWSSW
jgi:cytochrome oxidase Cu insertion factor (SCO1/SenC/PrrC family)